MVFFFVDKLQQCFSSNVHFLNVIFIYFKIACAVGFKGHNCGTKCTYPTYGQDCQMICFCSIKDCDFVSGCRRSLKGIKHISMAFNHAINLLLTPALQIISGG